LGDDRIDEVIRRRVRGEEEGLNQAGHEALYEAEQKESDADFGYRDVQEQGVQLNPKQASERH